jgi:hypothetical protein
MIAKFGRLAEGLATSMPRRITNNCTLISGSVGRE